MISYPCALYEDKLISPFLSLSDMRGATGYLRTRLKSSQWRGNTHTDGELRRSQMIPNDLALLTAPENPALASDLQITIFNE